MAYFSNSSEGDNFNEECLSCKYGEKACPIAFVQMNYNYDACNNKTAREILNNLIDDSGTCFMKLEFETDFAIDPNQIKLNL